MPPCGRACPAAGPWMQRLGAPRRALLSAKQAPDRLWRAEAGGSCRRPDVFQAGGPAGDMLPAGIRVVADVSHILNINHEQREFTRYGAPADLGGHRGGVAPLDGVI